MLKALVLLGLIQVAFSVQCHKCKSMDQPGSLLKEAFQKLNITVGGVQEGDCKAKSGDSACTSLMCVKKAVIYKIGYLGITYNYNQWTKECTGDITSKSGSCVDTSTEQQQGYTKIFRDCFCNDKDFCNAAPSTVLFTSITVMATVLLSYV